MGGALPQSGAFADPHRQGLAAVQEVRAERRRRARELDPSEIRDELLEPDAELESREMGTEAEVRAAHAESDVAVRCPADVETERVGELRLVAIGGDVPEHDLVAGAEKGAVELDVAGHRATEVVQ